MGLFLREERGKGRWGGRKGRTEGGPIISVKPRARKVSTLLIVKSTKNGVKRAEIMFNVTRKRKKGKEKRTETCSMS